MTDTCTGYPLGRPRVNRIYRIKKSGEKIMGVKNIRRKMAEGSSGSRRIARGVDVAAAAADEVVVGKPERGGRVVAR